MGGGKDSDSSDTGSRRAVTQRFEASYLNQDLSEIKAKEKKADKKAQEVQKKAPEIQKKKENKKKVVIK